MARLRVRVELNRGGVGIPLHKLASVVQESQKFFQMLAHDVHIEKDRGEWLAFDLDNGSLNFTAEYVGPVTGEQVKSFYAAFDGVTSLRKATIAQFTRVAEAIGEDELIGFGLYHSDNQTEPSEWRCLSRRVALRIADEIQLLAGAAGEMETHLPAVIDSDAGARLFKERHDRSLVTADQSKWLGFVRQVEANLGHRISRLENDVENHSGSIRELRETSAVTEESFRNLLSTVEKFCGQATREFEKLSPRPQVIVTPSSHVPPDASRSGRNWRLWIAAVVALMGIGIAGALFWPSKQAEPADREARVAESVPPGEPSVATKDDSALPVETRASKAVPNASPENSARGTMHIDLEAREAAWVDLTDAAGKTLIARILQQNEMRSFELTNGAILRTGNAGALVVRFNGKDVGPLGPTGKIRDIEFKNGTFRIHAPSAGTDSQGQQDNAEGAVSSHGQATEPAN